MKLHLCIVSAPLGSSKENGLMSPPHWNSGPTTMVNGDRFERRSSKDSETASQRKESSDLNKSSVKATPPVTEDDLPEGVGLLPPSTPNRDPPWSRGPMSPPHSIPQHSVLRSPFHVSKSMNFRIHLTITLNVLKVDKPTTLQPCLYDCRPPAI